MKPFKMFSIKHTPLIEIGPEYNFLNESHLTMRIFDILFRNIIEETMGNDGQSTAEEVKIDYFASLVTESVNTMKAFIFGSQKLEKRKDTRPRFSETMLKDLS